MKAEDIRKVASSNGCGPAKDGYIRAGAESDFALFEIAAQLAELNEHLRSGEIRMRSSSPWVGGPR